MTAFRNLTKLSELDDLEQNPPQDGETLIWNASQAKFLYDVIAPGARIRSGSGAPSNGLGVDNDWYLDTSVGSWYSKSSGAYTLVLNMATQAELDAHTTTTTAAHGGIVASSDSRLTDTRTPTDGSVTNAKVASNAALAYTKLNLASSVTLNDLAFDPATQAELDTHTALTTTAHGGIARPRAEQASLPMSNKMLAWSGDPIFGTSSGASLTAGALTVCKVWIPETITVSKAWTYVFQAGSGAQLPVNCYMSVHNSSGTRLGVTADQSTPWQSTGMKSATLTVDGGQSLTIPGGPDVYAFIVALIGTQSTTTVALSRMSGVAGAVSNVNLVAADIFRWGGILSGQTSIPTSFTPSSMVSGGNPYWMALS